MSSEEGRKLLNQDLADFVQNRIERCLIHYMNKKEVMNSLFIHENIEPHITELVWQRLEDENQEFFKAYYLKLLVKDQITEFNRLLSEQVELMHHIELTGITPTLNPNGSHVSPPQVISTRSCAAQSTSSLKADHLQQPGVGVFNNCGSSIAPYLQGNVDGSVHCSRKIDVSPSLFLSQNPNMGLAPTMNGKIVKAKAFDAATPFNFSPLSNYLESRALMGDASVSSFSSVDSSVQHLNDAVLDGGASPFGFYPPIPQSFPQLATDVTSCDLLESYCRFPFQAPDANNFGDPHGDIERLDPASESMRYQCFGGV